MTTPELTTYVRKRLRRGDPAGALRQKLLLEGYAEEVIEKAFVPRRQWSDPAQGFGKAQLYGSIVLIGLGVLRLTRNNSPEWGIGMMVTGCCCLLVLLLYRYEHR